MKPLKLTFSAAAILVATITVNAQTADDIINKHLDAVGGKDKLEQVKTLHYEATTDNGSPVKVNLVNGKFYKYESEFNGASVIQCFNEKTGWAVSPMGGGGAEEIPADQYKIGEDQLYISPFLDYSSKGAKVELLGKGADGYQIKLTNKDNGETTYYIDTTTYLVTKVVKEIEAMGNPLELTLTLSDYKKNDFGILMPYTIKTDYGTFFSSVATVKTVTINGDIDNKIFDMPK